MKRRIFTRTISVVLSEPIYQQLMNLIKQNDYSLSGWIREAINKKLENLKSL